MSNTPTPAIPERHREAAATWQPGQRWETLVDGTATWVPVSDGGRAQPLWDRAQDYRRVE